MEIINTFNHREPWNKGKLVGQKAPFKLKDLGDSDPFANGRSFPRPRAI